MNVRTRFAPSPTGFLHIGGARTALYNWLYAKKHGGEFILRVEDTDAERSSAESIDIILDGLRWLGLDWDEGPGIGGDYGPYAQSERSEIYDRYLAILEASGRVYSDDGAIRFRVPDEVITVPDLICGEVATNLKVQGSRRYDSETKREVESNPDIVIRRPDGSFIFHFVNVVDDIEMKISHVIRGEDHLSNTPKHLALFEAFGAKPPQFAHIPLNLNPSGSKMSKRDQGALIHGYRESGFLAEAVNNTMALLGWSPKDDQELFSLEELKSRFDLGGVNPSNSKFDYEKCRWINAEHLKRLSAGDLRDHAAPFLKEAGIDPDDDRIDAALDLARDRASLLSEIPAIISPIFSEAIAIDAKPLEKLKSQGDVSTLLRLIAQKFDAIPSWDEASIKGALGEIAEAQDIKVGALMFPSRIAATGGTSGADLMPMMQLIGRERMIDRLGSLADEIDKGSPGQGGG